MTFDDAFAIVVGIEGRLSMDSNDPGNWTGAHVGSGQLKGTKYGISAAVYPDEDIANLTLDRAKFLAKRDYWDKISGDQLDPRIALGLFDASYNEGRVGAVRVAQEALGISVDGVLGPGTLSALTHADPQRFARQFALERIAAYVKMPLWPQDGKGWTGRTLDIYLHMVMSN